MTIRSSFYRLFAATQSLQTPGLRTRLRQQGHEVERVLWAASEAWVFQNDEYYGSLMLSWEWWSGSP